MTFCDMTNADVFALTRERRVRDAARAQERAQLLERYGETVYVRPAAPRAPNMPMGPPGGTGAVRRRFLAQREAFRLAQRVAKLHISRIRRKALLKAQEGACYLCRGDFTERNGPSFDHVLPRALGGQTPGNVLLAHIRCNQAKSDRNPTRAELAYLQTVNLRLADILEEAGIYAPRRALEAA